MSSKYTDLLDILKYIKKINISKLAYFKDKIKKQYQKFHKNLVGSSLYHEWKS